MSVDAWHIGPISAGKFIAGWLPAMAISASVDAPRIGRVIVMIWGLPVPIIASALAILGVLASRPLAHRREKSLGWINFLIVTAVMMVAVELWVLEQQPGWLLTFVMAVGVGFSGYSLIELVGSEINDLVRSAFGLLRDRIGNAIRVKGKGDDDV